MLAVTTTLQCSQVLMAQLTSIPISADFPIPWPDATAIIKGMKRVSGFSRWARMISLISACQSRGPVMPASSPSPHG